MTKSFSEALEPRVADYTWAEFTAFVLKRRYADEDTPTTTGALVNGYAVLWFRRGPVPDEKRFAFLTPKGLETSPDGRHQLIAARTRLTVKEALDLWQDAEHYQDPLAPVPQPVYCTGAWIPLIYAGENEALRSCLPYIQSSFRALERMSKPGELVGELGARSSTWLVERIRELSGVSLEGADLILTRSAPGIHGEVGC